MRHSPSFAEDEPSRPVRSWSEQQPERQLEHRRRRTGRRSARPRSDGQQGVRVAVDSVASAQQRVAQPRRAAASHPLPVLRRVRTSSAPATPASRGRRRRAQQRGRRGGQDEQAQHGADPAGQLGRVGRDARRTGSEAAYADQPGQRAEVEHDARPGRRADPGAQARGDAGQVDPAGQRVAGARSRPASPASSGRPRRSARAAQVWASIVPRSAPSTSTDGRGRRAAGRRRPAGAESATASHGSPASSVAGAKGAGARCAGRSGGAGRDQVLGEQRRWRPGAARRRAARPGRPPAGRTRRRRRPPDQLEVRAAATGRRRGRAPARPAPAGGAAGER